MLNSAQNTSTCIWFDLGCSASGYVYCIRCSTCAPVSARLSVEHVPKSVFRAEWETPTPKVSAFSSAYIYQWLMTAPLHWQTRQQQKHQKDWQKDEEKFQKGKEEKKATCCTSELQLELELGLIALENSGRGGAGGYEWGKERATEKKGKAMREGLQG